MTPGQEALLVQEHELQLVLCIECKLWERHQCHAIQDRARCGLVSTLEMGDSLELGDPPAIVTDSPEPYLETPAYFGCNQGVRRANDARTGTDSH